MLFGPSPVHESNVVWLLSFYTFASWQRFQICFLRSIFHWLTYLRFSMWFAGPKSSSIEKGVYTGKNKLSCILPWHCIFSFGLYKLAWNSSCLEIRSFNRKNTKWIFEFSHSEFHDRYSGPSKIYDKSQSSNRNPHGMCFEGETYPQCWILWIWSRVQLLFLKFWYIISSCNCTLASICTMCNSQHFRSLCAEKKALLEFFEARC